MKYLKLTYFLLFAAVLCTSSGCWISNYGLITDNNQISDPGGPRDIVVTNGKAKLVYASQWATTWADGTDENLTYIRQDASGAQTLYTHNNFSVAGDATFSDDLYCSPEWKGCAAAKRIDEDAADPFDDPFDFSYIDHCPGVRSLCVVVSTGRYYGECGRTSALSLQDRLSLWNYGRLGMHSGMEVLSYDLNRSNISITLDNRAGVVADLPISGTAQGWVSLSGRRSKVMEMNDPLLSNVGRSYAEWLEHYGTASTIVSGCYNGVCRDWHIAGNDGKLTTPERVMDWVNRRW
ncbi:hypothetical protein ABI59_20100 [Acidobacteria bacterium Mor1]|nr:hypothetical protein ABI59_20100 [Acidobacteria bacterium Mor1]